MIDKEPTPHNIGLRFVLESGSSLWNVIFEGFDQEVVLVSRFESKEPEVINTLYRFAIIIKKRYSYCTVELKSNGIEIKKAIADNDITLVREWTKLMHKIREEISVLSQTAH